MKTQRDVFNRALTLLGVVGTGQTPEVEDWQVCRDAWRGMLFELRALEVINLLTHPTDEMLEEIPEEAFNAMAYLLASEIAPSFGVPAANLQQRDELILRLRRIVADPPGYYPQQANFF